MNVFAAAVTRRRGFVTWLVTLALVWAQMAVAAYACATAFGEAGSTAARTVATAADCAGHVEEADPLCFEHCHPGDESGPAAAPAIPGRCDNLLAVAAPPAHTRLELPHADAPGPDARPPPNIAFCSLQC